MIIKQFILILIILILNSCTNENEYRTITRDSSLISKDGVYHNQIKDFGEYHALLIYVEDYKYMPKLKTPKNDIEALEYILKKRYGFKVTQAPNPKNHDELLGYLENVEKTIKNSDNLLIYYAGHGEVDSSTKKGYWNLLDGKSIKDSKVGSVSLDETILDSIKRIQSKHILIVSDSCYSGVILRGKNEEGKFGKIDKNEKKYYNRIYNKKSRTAFTSGGLEPVLDTDINDKKHSIFAKSFLMMLEDNQNSIFALNEKYKKITQYITDNSGQTPEYEAIKNSGNIPSGDFIFLDKKSIFFNNKIITKEEKELSVLKQADKYLVWALVFITLLLIIVFIIYLKSKKSLIVSVENKENEIVIINNKYGVIDMSKTKVTYQNHPFTQKYTFQEAKVYAQKLRLGGSDKWRLPTRYELRALGNIQLYGEYNSDWKEWYEKHKYSALKNTKGEKHFIYRELLENMPENSWFWTSEIEDEDEIWRVGFHLGADKVAYDDDKNYVLCVRDKGE